MPEENENAIGFTTVGPTTEPEEIGETPNPNHMDAAMEPTPVVTTSAKANKPSRKAAAKTRTYAELADVTPAKMTDKELRLCVENLRAELILANNKAEMLDQNAKRAYEQCRQLQVAIQQKEVDFNNTIAFINQSTSVFARSVLLATQKGDK